MTGTFSLAWRYIKFHKFKTLILIACIFLTTFLPLAIRILLTEFDQKIVTRADRTPVVIGPRGSGLELTLKSLYFKSRMDETIPFSHTKTIREKDWGTPIPIYSRFTATGKQKGKPKRFAILGTNLDYFDFRNLELADGNMLTTLGDCVLGSAVAERLQLLPGDRLGSDRENVLDIGGLYPLNMYVRGILVPSNTPDDNVVFVDLKTAWIIEGLGHGHQDVTTVEDDKLIGQENNKIVASAAVLPYTEITDTNVGSFHFHGNTDDFPISAIIGIADDTKKETLMIGHYETNEDDAQIVLPGNVVRELMDMIFRVEKFFWANAILISISTLLLLLLVIMLSSRLRKKEMQTLFKLGSSRSTIGLMQFWELAFVFLIAGVLVAGAVWGVNLFAGNFVQSMLLN